MIVEQQKLVKIAFKPEELFNRFAYEYLLNDELKNFDLYKHSEERKSVADVIQHRDPCNFRVSRLGSFHSRKY